MLGDRDAVFGELDAPSEPLPAEYRSHGSLREMDVPLVIYNAHVRLKPEEFPYNRDLPRWLYAGCRASCVAVTKRSDAVQATV